MQAHAAAGNRAEALRVYDDCRRLLSEELGAYPSPETEALFQEYLREPDRVAAAPRTAHPVPEPAPTTGRRRRRSTPLLAVLVGMVVLAAIALRTTGDADSRLTTTPSRYSALDSGPSGLWGIEPANSAAVRLDSSDGTVRDTVPVGDAPAAVAVGGSSVWVANSGDGTVARVSPERGTVVQTISAGNAPTALALGHDSVWVANRLDSTVTRINARDGSVLATIAVPSAPVSLALAAGSVWVAGDNSAAIFRIDPSTNAACRPSARAAAAVISQPSPAGYGS